MKCMTLTTRGQVWLWISVLVLTTLSVSCKMNLHYGNCSSDDDCSGTDTDRCMSVNGAMFCSRPCQGPLECPGGREGKATCATDSISKKSVCSALCSTSEDCYFGQACYPFTNGQGGACLPVPEPVAKDSGVVPKPDKAAPKPDKYVPKPDKYDPKPDKNVPKQDKMVPKLDKNVPAPDISSKTCATVGKAGPKMVPVPRPGGGTYCMDSTEVTRDQYKAFSTAKPAGQPATCSWNTTYVPVQVSSGQCSKGEWPPGINGPLPVVCVDWCDAHMFCKWAGKRLCKVTWGQWTSAGTSEWYNACSKGGTQTYPYPGTAYQPSTCNGKEGGVGKLLAVKSKLKCEGGYPGIFDLSGNAWEWTTACKANTGSSDICRVAGGAFYTSQAAMFCGVTAGWGNFARNTGQSAIGFRCCAEP